MLAWKDGLLSAWYFGTLPWRQWRRRCERRQGRAPVMILFYHRVADEFSNDWTLSTECFTRQIDWLQKRFAILSLAEAQQRLQSGRNSEPAVCLTFDDGYADNCEHALPELIRRRIPCTYFVTTRQVIHGHPFPHDVAARRPLRPNTPEQIRSLAAAGVEIGAHTRTHADLGKIHDRHRLVDEVLGSISDLEQLTGRSVRYFAFPYGLHANLNPLVFQIAREAGLSGVCSAYGGYNYPGDEVFHLQRIHADPQWARFRNWLTGDPRKTRLPRYRDLAEPEPAGAAS